MLTEVVLVFCELSLIQLEKTQKQTVIQCFDNDLCGYYIQESYEHFGLSYICMYKWIHDKLTVKRKEEVTLEWLQKQKSNC